MNFEERVLLEKDLVALFNIEENYFNDLREKI